MPSFDVEPSRVDGLRAEGLWNPLPMGQVELIMFWHSVDERWYCPAGHMKTQQTPLMSSLLGAHGGAVEPVGEVRRQPNILQATKSMVTGLVAAPVKGTISLSAPVALMI